MIDIFAKWPNSFVKMPGGCLEWRGSRRKGSKNQRHGQVNIRVEGAFKRRNIHRLAWEMANGPIPDGLMVRHRCDNPVCCNVQHLLLGTHADNMADKIENRTDVGRRIGELGGRALLKEENIKPIRLRKLYGESYKSIAASFGVSDGCIVSIVRGRNWSHVR